MITDNDAKEEVVVDTVAAPTTPNDEVVVDSKVPISKPQASMMNLNGTSATGAGTGTANGTATAASGKGAELYPLDGYRAWLVVLGSFIALFIILGVLYSFGIFVDVYVAEFGASSAAVSTASTVGLASFFLFGIISGKLSDKYGTRQVFSVGMVFFVGALVGASYATNLTQIIICQGLLLGTGSSLCYFPAVTVIPMWFEKRRSFATALAVFGSGLGSLTYSIVGESLFVQIGWRATLRATAALSAGLLFVALLLLNRRLPRESKAGLFSDTAILRDRNYQKILVAAFFFQFAFMIPYVYLDAYAINLGISASSAAVATGAFGIGNAIGRIFLGAVGDYVSAVKVMRATIVAVGVTMFLWPACTNLSSIIAFALFYGFFSGGFVASNPVVLADFFGSSRLGGLMGYQSLAMVPGALSGAPLAGYIFDTTGSYTSAAIFGGVVLMIAGISMYLLDTSKMIRKIANKATTTNLLAEHQQVVEV